MKRNDDKKQGQAAKMPTVIHTFKELKQRLEQPVSCRIALETGRGVETLEIPCRRLDPKVKEQADAIVLSVVPEYSQKLKDYDFRDASYQLKLAVAQKKARALLVYAHCPLVAAEKPGLTDQTQIYEFVQGLLVEPVLEALALRIEGSGMRVLREVESQANFTSMRASES